MLDSLSIFTSALSIEINFLSCWYNTTIDTNTDTSYTKGEYHEKTIHNDDNYSCLDVKRMFSGGREQGVVREAQEEAEG